MKNQRGFIHIVAILTALVIFVTVGYYAYAKNSEPTNVPDSSNQMDSITSDDVEDTDTEQIRTSEEVTFDFLKYALNIPVNFTVGENDNTVLLTRGDEVVRVDRIGTNFTNIRDYNDDLNKKNSTTVLESKYSDINGYDGLIRKVYVRNMIQHQVKIYVDNQVYTFSTNSLGLDDEMEEISKSFKYLGEDEE